jgi:hypothetical protein
MIVTARAHASIVERTAEKLAVPSPKPYAAAIAQARKLVADSEQLMAAVPAVSSRAVELILTGQDPGTDEEIARRLVYRALVDSGLGAAATDRANDVIGAALVEHADDLIRGWDTALAGDFAALTAAAAVLDIVDLKDAELAALRQAGHIDVWATAATAADRIHIGHAGWQAIAAGISIQYLAEHVALSLAPDADISSIDAANATSSRPDAWLLARLGAPLRLATTADFVAAIGSYTAEKQRRYREHEEANRRTGFDTRRQAATI